MVVADIAEYLAAMVDREVHRRWLLELLVPVGYPLDVFAHPKLELKLNELKGEIASAEAEIAALRLLFVAPLAQAESAMACGLPVFCANSSARWMIWAARSALAAPPRALVQAASKASARDTR